MLRAEGERRRDARGVMKYDVCTQDNARAVARANKCYGEYSEAVEKSLPGLRSSSVMSFPRQPRFFFGA
jgi:hypothetical protein